MNIFCSVAAILLSDWHVIVVQNNKNYCELCNAVTKNIISGIFLLPTSQLQEQPMTEAPWDKPKWYEHVDSISIAMAARKLDPGLLGEE